MSADLRLKKLRGSGGYVMARVSDEQQAKGNLGGPDLFLAPVGRLDAEMISKHFCNTCEKEFEGAPKIDYESPNEEVAENLILAERGQYVCGSCGSTIAEYRNFTKPDESRDAGLARPQDPAVQPAAQAPPQATAPPPQAPPAQAPPAEPTAAKPAGQVSSIEGMDVYDENARKLGTARQVGVDASQTVVLTIAGKDGQELAVPWSKVRSVGDVVMLGAKEAAADPGGCPSCGFANKPGSKFCENCGTRLP